MKFCPFGAWCYPGLFFVPLFFNGCILRVGKIKVKSPEGSEAGLFCLSIIDIKRNPLDVIQRVGYEWVDAKPNSAS